MKKLLVIGLTLFLCACSGSSVKVKVISIEGLIDHKAYDVRCVDWVDCREEIAKLCPHEFSVMEHNSNNTELVVICH